MNASSAAASVLLVHGAFVDGSTWRLSAHRARAQRAGATTLEVAASHAVYMSQPAAVADFIEQAASAVAARQPSSVLSIANWSHFG